MREYYTVGNCEFYDRENVFKDKGGSVWETREEAEKHLPVTDLDGNELESDVFIIAVYHEPIRHDTHLELKQMSPCVGRSGK